METMIKLLMSLCNLGHLQIANIDEDYDKVVGVVNPSTTILIVEERCRSVDIYSNLTAH